MEQYRSGHNEPDSKSGCPHGHVSSNLTASAMSLFAVNVRSRLFLFCSFLRSLLGAFFCFRRKRICLKPCYIRLCRILIKQSVENQLVVASPVGSATRFLSNIPSITKPDSICAWKSR